MGYLTKVDADGVPLLVQRVRYVGFPYEWWEVQLFDGTDVRLPYEIIDDLYGRGTKKKLSHLTATSIIRSYITTGALRLLGR